MPFRFFVEQDFFWPPAPKAKPISARPQKPAARCRTKPRCKKPKKKKLLPKRSPVLSKQCRTILCDRLEAAIEDGRIVLCDEEMPCDSLDFTLAELAFLQRILLHEEYLPPAPRRKRPAKRTATAPGSAERIAEYAARAERGQFLYAAGDATAHRAHDRGLRIVQRANGSGVKVMGWADEG